MMQVLQPVGITPANVIASNAIEAHPAWAAGTFAKGVHVIHGESEYESLVADNASIPGVDATKWVRVGPSNKWAMFDKAVNTQTTAAALLAVTVAPGVVTNTAGFVNLLGSQINLTVRDGAGGPVIFSGSKPLDDSIITSWYDYFFEPFSQRTEVVFDAIPPYSTARFEVEVVGGGQVGVGGVVIGSAHDIGEVLRGTGFGIDDYSQVEEDKYGNIQLAEGNYARRMNPQVLVSNNRLHYVSRLLAKLRQTPTLWIGSKDKRFQSLIVFGFVRRWNVAIEYPNESLIDFEIRGMTDVI